MAPALLLAASLLLYPPAARSRVRLGRRALPFRVPAVLLAVMLSVVGVMTVPVTTMLAAVAVIGTVELRRRRRAARLRVQREGRTLGSALELLTAELRAGAHPVRAFDIAAGETPGRVGAGLRTVAARAALGADVAAGLRAAAPGSGMPGYWERLSACWQLAVEHGLPIGVLMRAAQTDITGRHRYAAQVDAGMAGARATAVILAALPLLGVLFGELLGASPMVFLSQGAGGWVLVIGVGLLCAGVLWAGRITDRT